MKLWVLALGLCIEWLLAQHHLSAMVKYRAGTAISIFVMGEVWGNVMRHAHVQVRQRRKAAAGSATDPFFILDCRTAGMDTSTSFRTALKAAFAEVVLGSEDLPAIPMPDSPEPLSVRAAEKPCFSSAKTSGNILH